MRATGTLFCTTTVSAGESNPHPGAGHERRDDDPRDALGKCHDEQEQPENVHDDSNDTGKTFSDPMYQAARAEANVLQPIVNAPTTKPTIARFS